MKIDILEFLKTESKIMLAISITSGLLLFIPNKFREVLYITIFMEKFGIFVGLTFLISSSIVLVQVLSFLYKKIVKKYKGYKFKKDSVNKILNLDENELNILRKMYSKDNKTLFLPYYSGSVRYLDQTLIISRLAVKVEVYDVNDPHFPYSLNPWFLDLIKENEEIRKWLN